MYLLSSDFRAIASSFCWLDYSTLLFNCPYCRKFLFKLPSTSWTIAFSRFGLYPQWDMANAHRRHTYFAIKAVEKFPSKQIYVSGVFESSQRLNRQQRSITIDSNCEISYRNPFQDGKLRWIYDNCDHFVHAHMLEKKRFKRKASACRLLNGDWRKSALWDGWGCFWGIRVSQDRNQTSTQKHHLYMGPKMKTQLTPTYEKGTIWNHVTFHCTGNRDPCATCTNWVV